MDEQPRPQTSTEDAHSGAAVSGSTWAELDEAYFRLVQDTFSHGFCAGASALLASNDAEEPDAEIDRIIELPEARLSHESTLELINQEIDRELQLRREAMRRHPSRRRF
jgi:hypothetical protein